MKCANKTPRLSLVFFFLLAVLTVSCPTLGRADTSPSTATPDCSQSGDFATKYSANMTNQALAKRNAIYNTHNQLAKIQADLFACLDGVYLAYQMGPLLHNPLGFIENALIAAFWLVVDTLMDQVCHMVVSAVNSIVNQIVASVVSLANFACIPALNLGLNINTNLNLPHIPCNGTPLIPGSAIISQTPNPTGSSSWRLLNRTSE